MIPGKQKSLGRKMEDLYDECAEAWQSEASVPELGYSYDALDPARSMLFTLFGLLRRKLGDDADDDIRQLFGKYGPRTKRDKGVAKKRAVAREYGLKGMPPKQRFARELAEANKQLPRGKRWGSGTTSPKTMLTYLNRMLKTEDHQRTARYHSRKRSQPAVK